ncbi:hypothetical protein CsSME_00016575 [Camellia sinensis var. sinensis]
MMKDACMLESPCWEIPHDAPICLYLHLIPECCTKLQKVVDQFCCRFPICCNREQEKGMAKYFHIYMHDYSSRHCMSSRECSPQSSCHQSRISMHDGRGVELHTRCKMNAHKTQQDLDSIMDNPECRRPGIETRFITLR